MIQKKICLLGAVAVGKTSLVRRYVKRLFDERYHTSLGVKIDKKLVSTPHGELMLMIWDLSGEDEFIAMELEYLRGAAGFLLVADGTRRSSLDRAMALQQRAAERLDSMPFLLLANKSDLTSSWEIGDADLDQCSARGWTVIRTSAKSGEGVEQAFQLLADRLLAPRGN